MSVQAAAIREHERRIREVLTNGSIFRGASTVTPKEALAALDALVAVVAAHETDSGSDRSAVVQGTEQVSADVWDDCDWSDLRAGDSCSLMVFGLQTGWERERRRVLSVKGTMLTLAEGDREYDYDYEADDGRVKRSMKRLRVAVVAAAGPSETESGDDRSAVASEGSEGLDEAALTAAHLAVEDVLANNRDARLGMLGYGNGFVIAERDGTSSSVMRLGTRDGLRIAISAYLARLGSSVETGKQENDTGDGRAVRESGKA